MRINSRMPTVCFALLADGSKLRCWRTAEGVLFPLFLRLFRSLPMLNSFKSFATLSVATVAVAFASERVDAAVLVVSSADVFAGIVGAMDGVVLHEEFAAYNGFYASGLAGGTGDSAWTADAVDGLWAADGIMSTNMANAPLTFTFASDNVFAIGGNFFNTNTDFSTGGGLVKVSAGGTTYIFSSTSIAGFGGFVSTSGAIHSITITTFGGGAAGLFASTDHVSVGVIPSPAVLALGALAGMITRRRRN